MVVPFALSIHSFINSVGAYVGFASIVGLALLVLLLFAQARETSTLRGRVEEAGERIGMLESRLAHALRAAQAAARPTAPGAPAVTPPPIGAGVRAASVAVPSVRRVPAPATAATLLRSAPAAPMGIGAPALASATRLVTVVAPVPVPPTAPVPAAAPMPAAVPAAIPAAAGAAGAAGAARSTALQEPGAPDDTVLVAPATAAAARGNGHDRTALVPPVAVARNPAATAPPPSPPPRAQIRPEVGAPPRRALPPPPRPTLAPRRSRLARVATGLVGILVVAGIVAALLKVTGGGTNTTAGNHPTRAGRHGRATAVRFHPSHVTVAVLNGTAVTHLAKDVSTRLGKAGYAGGTVANAVVQTHTDTIVAYLPHHRAAAIHVAKTLHVPSRAVEPADRDAIGMCSAGATTGGASCSADVIVTVGTNLASLASAAGAG